MYNPNVWHARLPFVWRYLLAVCFFAMALVARLLLPFDSGVIFTTFYAAIIFSFYLCGRWPGVSAILLSAVAASYIYLPPFWSWSLKTQGVIALLLFLGTSLLIGLLVEQLHGYLRRLDDFFTATPVGMLAIDPKRQVIIDVNPAFLAMFGYQRDEVFGKTIVDFTYPEDLAATYERNQLLFAGKVESVHFEKRYPKKDGGSVLAEVFARCLKDRKGRPALIIGSMLDITQRRQLERQTVQAASEIQDLYDNAPCGYHSLDAEGRIININKTELDWLGCSREQAIGRSFIDFTSPAGCELFKRTFPVFLRDGHIENLEFELVSTSGKVRLVSISATAIFDSDGQFVKSRSVIYDIDELKAVERRLMALGMEQQAILDSELVGIAKVRERKVIWHNQTLCHLFGYEACELDNADTRMLYPDFDAYESMGKEAYPVLETSGVFRDQRLMRRKDGSPVWMDISGTLLSGDSGESLWMVADVTAKREQQQRIERFAYHDALTDLPNRLLIADRLAQSLAQAERSASLMAVCYVDLDGFKPVNDRHGHEAGDRLLVEIAHRMLHAVRANDSVGRVGGDEFVILLNELETVEEYQLILVRILDAIRQPIMIQGNCNVEVGASIGVAVFPFDGHDPDLLLRRADQAMYRAKQSGRNRVELFAS